jgi:hypothetical protein
MEGVDQRALSASGSYDHEGPIQTRGGLPATDAGTCTEPADEESESGEDEPLLAAPTADECGARDESASATTCARAGSGGAPTRRAEKGVDDVGADHDDDDDSDDAGDDEDEDAVVGAEDDDIVGASKDDRDDDDDDDADAGADNTLGVHDDDGLGEGDGDDDDEDDDDDDASSMDGGYSNCERAERRSSDQSTRSPCAQEEYV